VKFVYNVSDVCFARALIGIRVKVGMKMAVFCVVAPFRLL
jgi:hypothetical protein